MKKHFILSLCVLVLSGCVHFRKDISPVPPPAITFEKESTKLGEVSSSLKRGSDKIGETSSSGIILSQDSYLATKDVNFNTLKGKFENIFVANNDVVSDIKKIDEINSNLCSFNKDLITINQKLSKDVEKYKSDSLKSMRTVWYFVGALSAIILCFGVATSIFYKPNFGVPFALTGIALASISYFMVAYIKAVAIIGGFVFVGGIAFLIYQMYVNRKAVKESVMTVEATKYKIWDDLVKLDVDAIQSPSTKKIVASVKKEISSKSVKPVDVTGVESKVESKVEKCDNLDISIDDSKQVRKQGKKVKKIKK